MGTQFWCWSLAERQLCMGMQKRPLDSSMRALMATSDRSAD